MVEIQSIMVELQFTMVENWSIVIGIKSIVVESSL